MKTFITLSTALLVLTFAQNLHAQTYVNAAATGNNDGTSWADAYTELADALDNYSTGDEIWVATGTYLPGSEASSTFLIATDLKLYGGFAGTESSLSERDIENNPTILSGDVADDDVIDELTTNRADNVSNIMYIENTVTAETIIDGFIFEGGHADGPVTVLNGLRGGGVWSLGPAQFFNCTFRQNYASISGGAIYFREELCAGGKVLNGTFDYNFAGAEGGGLTAFTVIGKGIEIDSCQFTNNRTSSVGGGIFFLETNGEIKNSHFDGNSSSLAAGAVFIDHTVNPPATPFNDILNCTFENNESSNAGALGFQSLSPGHHYQVKNCSFVGNSASEITAGQTRGGGALFFFNFSNGMTALVDSCHFENNTSENLGGAMTFFETESSSNNQIEVRHSTFQSNQAVDGGAFSFFSSGMGNCKLQITSCVFTDNTNTLAIADNTPDGGALCFEYSEENPANDTLLINDCLLENNQAMRYGGGIAFFNSVGTNNYLELNNCEITGNSTDFGGEGGGMAILEGANTSSVSVRNTIFSNNTADEAQSLLVRNFPGATIPQSSHIELLNCLLTNHNPNNSNAIVVAALDSDLILTNCTFAENDCSAATLFPLSIDTKLTLQNTIMQSGSFPDYFLITGGLGNEVVQSLGGNLIGSDALDAFLNGDDQSSTDALLESGTFQLSQNSPAVDAGTPLANPVDFDLAGNDRIQGTQIDAGAYESPFVVSTREKVGHPQALQIYPNPATTFIQVALKNNWTGDVQIRMMNALGQEVYTTQRTKATETYLDRVMVSRLEAGQYQLILSNGKEAIVKSFTKVRGGE